VTVARHTDGLVPAGALEDFPENEFRVLEIDGREIGIVRTGGGVFAVRNRCPHQGAAICAGFVTGTMRASAPQQFDYADDASVVVCPWHRWEFELATGRAVGGISSKRLVTYPVEVVDGQVYVALKRRVKR
jgi:nitrite reductase/ring-hydroxylating ferredoxin subunit